VFKPLLRLSILATIWLKFGRQILLAIALILAIILFQFIAQDINEYLSQTNQTHYLGHVLLIKWVLILSFIFGYLFYLKLSLGKKAKPSSVQTQNKSQTPSGKDTSHKPDPFAHLRDKKVLRSKGDILIEKQKSKNNKK